MKLAVIADIHYDLQESYSRQEIVDEFIKQVQAYQVDILVIAGDISNHYSTSLAFVEELQRSLLLPVYFVPGNHDFWSAPEDLANQPNLSWQIFESYRSHPQVLMGRGLPLTEDTWLFGSSAWYNHAGNQGRHSEDFLEQGHYQGYTWQDKDFIHWPMTDREFSNYLADDLVESLNNSSAKQVILVTHMVTLPEFQIPDDLRYQEDIDYFNSFISTDDFDRIYEQFSIVMSFMGHVHQRRQLVKNGVTYYACSLGTQREWEENTDLATNLSQALIVVDI